MDVNPPRRLPVDPATPRFTAATAEEIRYADELRRRLEERYHSLRHLERRDDKYWCIGAD